MTCAWSIPSSSGGNPPYIYTHSTKVPIFPMTAPIPTQTLSDSLAGPAQFSHSTDPHYNDDYLHQFSPNAFSLNW